jgi:lysophospholipase L1-like esterase
MMARFRFAGIQRVPVTAMSTVLAPVLLAQARRTARRIPRLDPASGPDGGAAHGSGPPLRLMVIGESTAVGVGAVTHTEALPGFVAEAVKDQLDRTVTWCVCGRNGATARKLITDVIPTLRDPAPDLVVLTVGVNDLLRRRPLDKWSVDVTELVATLRDRYCRGRLLVAGLPPVQQFAALPQPLRFVLGARARAMDRVLRETVLAHGATHVPMDESSARDPSLFASDGFHPSPAGYRAWASVLAQAAVRYLADAGIDQSTKGRA